MRGADVTQESLFTVAKLADFVPANHPLRSIRELADEALRRMSGLFSALYADTGRASIAPEKLMRAQLLQLFYSKPEPTEPAVRQVEMHLFAQPALGTDAEAVADDQHANQQRRIDRWAARVAVVRRQMLVQTVEVEEPVDATQQMVRRDVVLEVEGVEQRRLRCLLPTHHRVDSARLMGCQWTSFSAVDQPSFSTE